jgi:hypothetical protein
MFWKHSWLHHHRRLQGKNCLSRSVILKFSVDDQSRPPPFRLQNKFSLGLRNIHDSRRCNIPNGTINIQCLVPPTNNYLRMNTCVWEPPTWTTVVKPTYQGHSLLTPCPWSRPICYPVTGMPSPNTIVSKKAFRCGNLPHVYNKIQHM